MKVEEGLKIHLTQSPHSMADVGIFKAKQPSLIVVNGTWASGKAWNVDGLWGPGMNYNSASFRSGDITSLGLGFLIYIMRILSILQSLKRMPCIKYLVYSIDTWKCCFLSFQKHPELADVIEQPAWLQSWVILLYQSAVSSSGIIPPLTTLDAIMCSHLRR